MAVLEEKHPNPLGVKKKKYDVIKFDIKQ